MFPILLSSHSRHWLWWSRKSHLKMGWSSPAQALQEYNQGRGYKRRHKASLAGLTWGFLKRINLKKDHSIPCPSNRQNPCECSFLTSVSGSMSFVTWYVLDIVECFRKKTCHPPPAGAGPRILDFVANLEDEEGHHPHQGGLWAQKHDAELWLQLHSNYNMPGGMCNFV